jgi:hypothetical protein
VADTESIEIRCRRGNGPDDPTSGEGTVGKKEKLNNKTTVAKKILGVGGAGVCNSS